MTAVLGAQEPGARYLGLGNAVLATHLGLWSAAENGISKLRELIAMLAVRGMIDDRNGRTEKGAPCTWRIGALGDVVIHSEAGWSPSCDSSQRASDQWAVLKVSAVSWGEFRNDENKRLPSHLAPRPQYEAKEGDFLLSRANTAELVARSVVAVKVQPRLMLSDKIIRLRFSEQADPRFFNIVNNAPDARAYYGRAASGTSSSMKNVSRAVVLALPVPIPPLAEQHRIVARVEELMKLCAALEQNGRLADEQHARLTSTLFNALAASESAQTLAENWQRVAEHFDLLLDRPEAIASLEQTILKLAVHGLLVPQIDSDEPASRFLARLSAPLSRRGAEGLHGVAVVPYEVPAGWEWRTLESIVSVGTGTTPSRTNALYFYPPEINWVTSSETGQPFIAATSQAVSAAALNETSLKVYPVGTLIVAMYGQGKTRGQISELLIPAATNQACAAIVPIELAVHHRRYIKLFFEKSYDELREESAGGAQPNLNVGKIKSTLIPVPPLAEQHRIVARVEELRRLCADLRQRLTDARNTQSRLADALVAEAA